MAEGARKAACSSVRDRFCFDGNGSDAKAPRHRVSVAHGTGTGAQGAGLDFCSRQQDSRSLTQRLLVLSVDAFHIDNFAAKSAEHLLHYRILFRRLAQALFI